MSVILPVAQRGEEILKLKAAPVAEAEFNSEWLMQLASVMHATMLERNGVGIAAPHCIFLNRLLLLRRARIYDTPTHQKCNLWS